MNLSGSIVHCLQMIPQGLREACVGREAIEGLQSSPEVVGVDEVGEVTS